MQELDKKEMLAVEGGIAITSTLISTLIKGADLVFEIGKSLGSSIRRLLMSESSKL